MTEERAKYVVGRVELAPNPFDAAMALLAKKSGSGLEAAFERQLLALGCPAPVRQFRFAPPRRFTADFAYPDHPRHLLIEIEGATWARGRHTRGGGYARDCLKYNLAGINGWLVLRYTADMVGDWSAARQVAELLGVRYE